MSVAAHRNASGELQSPGTFCFSTNRSHGKPSGSQFFTACGFKIFQPTILQVELDLKEPLFFSPAAAGHLYIVKKNFYFHDTIRIGKFEGDFTSCLADVIKCACPLREDASWGQLGGPSGSLSLEADLVQSTFYNFP